MKASDVRAAADAAHLSAGLLCVALGTVLPLLYELRARQGGAFGWVLRFGMDALIGALEAYSREQCGGSNAG